MEPVDTLYCLYDKEAVEDVGLRLLLNHSLGVRGGWQKIKINI